MTRRILAALGALTLVAAACGGDDDVSDGVASIEETGTVAPVDPKVDREGQLLEFAACMRQQGIDLPDPIVDADGNAQLQPPADFEPSMVNALIEAAQTCQTFLEGVTLGFEDIDLAALTDTLLAFAQCMRDNDFDLPDPDLSLLQPDSGSVPSGGPFGNIDLQDPDFLTAFAACSDVIADLGVPAS